MVFGFFTHQRLSNCKIWGKSVTVCGHRIWFLHRIDLTCKKEDSFLNKRLVWVYRFYNVVIACSTWQSAPFLQGLLAHGPSVTPWVTQPLEPCPLPTYPGGQLQTTPCIPVRWTQHCILVFFTEQRYICYFCIMHYKVFVAKSIHIFDRNVTKEPNLEIPGM